MRSDQHHIDEFFRNQEEAMPADNSHLESDWQSMKSLLQPATMIVPGNKKQKLTRRLAWAAIAAGIIVTTAIILNKQSKNIAPAKPVVQKTETPVTTPSANNDTIKAPAVLVVTSTPKIQVVTTPVGFMRFDTPDTVIAVQPVQTANPGTVTPLPDNASVFSGFYKAIEKPAEVFSINPLLDTQLVCKEGTKLFIPAGSFRNLAGTIITSTVQVSVKEFYEYADIIAHKLSTLSDGRPLSSGGMIHIEASSLNEQLSLTQNAKVGLKMPARDFQPTMQLFTGKNISGSTPGQIQINTEQAVPVKDTFIIKAVQAGKLKGDTIALKATSVNEVTNLQAISLAPAGTITITTDLTAQSKPTATIVLSNNAVNWIPAGQQQFFYDNKKKIIRLLNVTDNPVDVRNYKNNTKTKGQFVMPYYSDLEKEELKKILQEKYGSYYDKIQVKKSRRPIAKWKRDIEDEPADWYETKNVGDTIFIPLHVAMRMKMINREDSLYYESMFKKELEDAIKQQNSYAEFLVKSSEYSFTIRELGWINCDRFLNYPKNRLTDLIVKADDGFSDGYFQAMVIFEKDNACLNGSWNKGTVVFPNLPLGKEVQVVCTGVKDGKMFASIQQMIVERNPPPLVFEMITPEAFREKLSRFGTVN
ncbi:MAG: hypothetical protein IPP93_07645 [Chitinophagaceae bacterium]|nr:hypothetical protein [Chitinophagaceae bacterium]